ncbi:MAG: 3-methyl-2-oxobutanoate hydroxymethyltransferase [Candidatus Omnitrophica bacterium]|nr:3-methyl-2-oxobutanoate hydroxymethyltransferase [Candidatus Omnitrophota bacterium]
MQRKKITVKDVIELKKAGKKITMLTAYDYPVALILDQAGIDIILVGDSLGNVVLGYDSTVPVSMDEMVHHTKAVKRATKYALLAADMPFMSFNVSLKQTVINAGRFVKDAGADAVKIEGENKRILRMIRAVVDSGIPVIGHLGLTPQTAMILGGYKVQGKTAQAAKEILEQALCLEKAGCFSIVLECVPFALSEVISKRLKIPVIGIGAGAGCDGQVLVSYDMFGLQERITPKFVKKYLDLSRQMSDAVKKYIRDVRQSSFPGKEHSFIMPNEELDRFLSQDKS